MSDKIRVGDSAEMAFDLEATKRGFNVSRPASASMKYDRILEVNGRMFRVQIKTANNRSKYFSVMLTTSNGKPYSSDEIDIFAVYVLESNQWHFIKPNNATSISLGVRKAINNNWQIFTDEFH
jgi:hypothetical protein